MRQPLGAMNAAQLFDAATCAHPHILSDIGRGDFSALLSWLRTHIHTQASRYSARELMLKATGRALDVAVFHRHLENRYLG